MRACLATFGITQTQLGLLFMIAASRLTGAAETALIGARDTPLAPFLELDLRRRPADFALVLMAVIYEMGPSSFSRRRWALPEARLAPPDACLPPTSP
ncbi:hypothetical protein SAMN07250955_11830 [Arboricoccus pini]|uniref:Uncharacterized protein n=1 Tax=Arboricoccus pini TaxID=1963835 RepID=A0A212RZX4_9PROT|nr:hypothetical protein SAMN07250955_11830 [Arboricoccus pini]